MHQIRVTGLIIILYITEIKSARSSGVRYILFIDDLHNLSGLTHILRFLINHSYFKFADISRLKHHLKAGDYQCIGTTTPRHYDDVIQLYGSSDYLSDIQIAEPSIPETVNILRTISTGLTAYHGGGLGVEDAALHQAVNMAKRLLASTTALPKSAIQALDQACSLVRTKRSEAFESLECVQCRKVALQVEIAALRVSASITALTRFKSVFLDPNGFSSAIIFNEASTELTSVEEQCSTLQNALRIEHENERLCLHLASLHKIADDARER
jgi:ATP-dependent Clp protease ATP-binding subunit ClpA